MKSKFIRFVVGTEQDNPYLSTGVFTIARILRDDGELQPYAVEIVNEVFEWFNESIPCPPFTENIKSGEWTEDAVAWFKTDATQAINRMWDIISVLKEHDQPVRFLQTETPGKIVYEDQFQIVAETPKYPIWK
jgi:hypothetical protein